MSSLEIFLSCALAALVQAAYKGVTGRDLFPANPKGPLYKWFGPKEGRATHADPQSRLESPPHGRPMARLSGQPILLHGPRSDDSEQKL